MTRRIATVTPARSGGWLLSVGSAVPQWFADGRDADREANARNLISPAGTSGTPLGSPQVRRPGSNLPTVAASEEAGLWQSTGGVAGDHDPRTPATYLDRPHGGEAVDRLATAAAKGVREALANVDSGRAR